MTPRQTIHRGTVLASGFWLERAAFDRASALAHLVDLYPRAKRYDACADGIFVELQSPELVDCGVAPAAPLVNYDGVHASTPLRPSELQSTASPDAVIALVQHGEIRVLGRKELESCDPSEWLDLSTFELENVAPLGPPAAAPLARIEPVPAASELFDGRIGRTREHHERQRALIDALTRERSGDRSTGRGSVLRWLTAVGRWFRRWAQSATSAAAAPSRALALPARAKPSLFRDTWVRLDNWLKRMLLRSWLGNVIGRRHVEYLQRLFEMLDSKQDLEALRHAIPLSHGFTERARLALLPPTPRSQISISPTRAAGSSALVLENDLFGRLRASYEAAFERLDAADRVDEAAFVLAELLDDAARAVAYLERKGRLTVAAELAESRQLEPTLVVRQWFLAKNVRRAVAIAVRAGCFVQAIERLERTGHREEGLALRLVYAERLANAGHLVKAAETAEPVQSAIPLALRWLELARDQGDLGGVVLELKLAPTRLPSVWQSVQSLLEDTGTDAVITRTALAEQLLRTPLPVTGPIARELGREMIADAGVLGDARLARIARRLGDWVGGAFRADIPFVVAFEQRAPPSPAVHRCSPTDVGHRAVFDVAKVGNRFLLALGEAGVRLVDRNAKTVAHFDVPADQLVTCEGSHHVLALAPRGEAWRISRIHLGTRRCEPWTELRLGAFARSFDGQTWVVATEASPFTELLVLDVVDDRPTVVHRRDLEQFAVDAIDVHDHACCVLGGVPFGPAECLRYEVPHWTLRQRFSISTEAPPHAVYIGTRTAGAPGVIARYDLWLVPETGQLIGPELTYAQRKIPLPPGLVGKARLLVGEPWFVLTISTEKAVRIAAGSCQQDRVLLDLTLDGSSDAGARLFGPLAVIADRAGRLLVYDLSNSRRVVDLRVS